MPFLVLLVLTLICLQGRWPEPPEFLGPAGSALLTWLGVALLAAAAAWTGSRLARRLLLDPWRRQALLGACARQRRYLVLGLVGFYVLALYGLGWGWTARALLTWPGWSARGAEMLILAPFLAGLFLLWAAAYDLERTIHDTSARAASRPFPGRWPFVALQARHNLLLALPPLLLLLLQQTALSLLPENLQEDPRVLPALALGLLVGIFIGIPWMLRLFLGLRPLPEGPLRDRLLATARRLQFRCSDILLWDTRGTIANAMVTGPLPLLRYVVLTDRLAAEMTPEEIEAVFGHKVGHVKHHHMLFYFGFLMVSLVAVAGLWNALAGLLDQEAVRTFFSDRLPLWEDWADAYEVVTVLPLVALVGAYVFVVFGFLSRRCERQADIYGCRTVSGPVFIEALEKVARLNGISRDRPGWLSSWQHSTIARRVEFLEQLHSDPGLGQHFQRRIGLVKWGVVLGLGGVLAALGPERVWSILKQL